MRARRARAAARAVAWVGLYGARRLSPPSSAPPAGRGAVPTAGRQHQRYYRRRSGQAPLTSSDPEVARGLHLFCLVPPLASRRPRPLPTSSASKIARRLSLLPGWARACRRPRLRPRAHHGRGQDHVEPPSHPRDRVRRWTRLRPRARRSRAQNLVKPPVRPATAPPAS